jgi:DNA-binding protein HU-beta
LPESSLALPEIARGSWKSVANGFTVSSSRSKEDHWSRRFCMNKAELIDVLTEKLGSDRRQATAAVENVVDTIVRAVHKGDSVTITGFGVFEQRRRAARVARNPRTGETVKVKPTSVPAFRPGAQFKAVVSGAQRLPAEGPAVKRGVTAGTARKAVKKAVVKKAVRKAAVKKVVKRAAVKKAVKKAVVKKAVKKAAVKKAVKKAAVKKAVKRTAVKKAVKKAPARKAAVKKAAAKKTARKAPAKRGRR